MSTNDGQKLLVFGLGFAQHDSRKMQQVLRHYDRMPANPGSRAALFVELTRLGKQLALDEQHQIQAQKIEGWMRNGGEFPLAITPAPINAAYEGRSYVDHTASLAGSAGWPLERRIRYGPGHTLEATHDVDGNVQALPRDDRPNDNSRYAGNPAVESQQEWDAMEVEPARGSPEREDSEMGQDSLYNNHDMDGILDDEHGDEQTLVPAREAFHGRGRTLDDAEYHPAVTTEHQDELAPPGRAPPAPRPGTDNGVAVPQLRGDQQWRGNNVHGLQHRMMGMGMGMGIAGLGLPPGMGPHHGRRRRRPRMEHDLEDEDEDEMGGLDGWHGGRGQFALGPGRTLNDPPPVQNEAPNQFRTAEDPNLVDQFHHSDSESENASSVGNPDNDDAEPTECPICLEEYAPSGFPKRATVTELCDHPDKACLQCLNSSITGIVETGALHILACPICPQKLTWRDVKEYASKKVYERYKYLKQQALRPGHYISCTNSSCGGSQAHDCDGPSGPKMTCNFCQAETCARHRRPWHEGQTCLEFDMDPAQIERLEEEEATAKLLAKEATSICPKCGQGVTKTEGCDHMMCQCGTEWCYVVSDVYCFPLLASSLLK